MQDKEDYIELSNEDLYKIIPWFSACIEVGRKGYRMDLTPDELATNIINYNIKKNRKKRFKVITNDSEE